MSESVLISIITQAAVIVGLFIAWIRERRKDHLTADEIQERIEKSRLETIAELQSQLTTATKAEGDLRLELNRTHADIEKMQQEITGLHQQLAANAETIAANAETISQLLVEKREAMNDKAVWQRKYLDAVTEREAFMELLQAMKQKTELLDPLRDKIEAMERRLAKVSNDTDKLKQTTAALGGTA